MAIAILFAKIINFREISTKVTTDSVWLLQHRLLFQFMKRKSVFKTRKRHTTKLPRKSIQGYLAMYPRINRQVSSITLPSILASFFRRACHLEGVETEGLVGWAYSRCRCVDFQRTTSITSVLVFWAQQRLKSTIRPRPISQETVRKKI